MLRFWGFLAAQDVYVSYNNFKVSDKVRKIFILSKNLFKWLMRPQALKMLPLCSEVK